MPREFEKHPIILSDKETFHTWMPHTSIEGVTNLSDIPIAARKLFEARSRMYIPPRRYKLENFLSVCKITHSDGSFSWAARQAKTMTTLPGKVLDDAGVPKYALEESVYLVDTGSRDEFAGCSYMVMDHTPIPFFNSKPFEEWSQTADEFQRRGLATRRTFTLNALSQTLYGIPIHSSDHFIRSNTKDGTSVQPVKLMWEKLVQEGLATEFFDGNDPEDKIQRFVFTSERNHIADHLPTVRWS